MKFDTLLEQFGKEKAVEVWKQICTLGGFGDVPTTAQGGLDLSGVEAKAKAEIDKLIKVKGDK